MADLATPPKPEAEERHQSFFRRHLALTALAVILVLLIGTVGGFLWYLNHELGNIRHFDAGITPARGPHGSASDAGRPLNVLVLGSHDRNTESVADDLADGRWTQGVHSSDTMMVVHIPANRQSVQVVSIPRDSWVRVPGYPGDVDGFAKINASFSWGGPALAVRTIQSLTGLHLDHVAMIDWNGFKDLTDVIGGVRVYIPKTFTDPVQHIRWEKGWQNLNGYQALQYVRTRHGLVDGDLGRIERQQNFLRTIVAKIVSSSTFTNPITLARVVGAFSSFVQVDNTWTTSDLRSLAISMRNLTSADVRFTTAPLGRYDVIDGQDVVILDRAKTKVLWADLGHGTLTHYLQQYPGSALPGDTSIR